MGTTDTTHMLLVVALEVMKIAIITVTTAVQSLATTVTIVMIVVIMIDGTVVVDDATKTKAHCRTM